MFFIYFLKLVDSSVLYCFSLQPNDRDIHRRTALHVTSEAGHASVVSALLENGADYDAVDDESKIIISLV